MTWIVDEDKQRLRRLLQDSGGNAFDVASRHQIRYPSAGGLTYAAGFRLSHFSS